MRVLTTTTMISSITTSQILYANEQLNIISDIDEGINAGKVRPGTKISADLKCALLQPRYGAVDFRNIKEVALENVRMMFLMLS